MKETLPTSSKVMVTSVLALHLLVTLPLGVGLLYVSWTLLKVIYYMLQPILNLIL